MTLTAEERLGLEHVVSLGKAAARKFAYARILLSADEGLDGPTRTDEDIVAVLGVAPRPSPGTASVHDRGLRRPCKTLSALASRHARSNLRCPRFFGTIRAIMLSLAPQ